MEEWGIEIPITAPRNVYLERALYEQAVQEMQWFGDLQFWGPTRKLTRWQKFKFWCGDMADRVETAWQVLRHGRLDA